MDAPIAAATAPAISHVAAAANNSNSNSNQSSSSSSNSSGYGSATTRSATPLGSNYETQSATTKTSVANQTAGVPTAAVAAVAPFYNEAIAASDAQRQQYYQSSGLSSLSSLSTLPSSAAYVHPEFAHSNQQYNLYDSYISGIAAVSAGVSSGSTGGGYSYQLDASSSSVSGSSGNSSINSSSRHSSHALIEKRATTAATNGSMSHVSGNSNSNSSSSSSSRSSGHSASVKDSNSAIKKLNESTSGSKPQATATPFYAQPLLHATKSADPITGYYDSYKYKMSKLPNATVDYTYSGVGGGGGNGSGYANHYANATGATAPTPYQQQQQQYYAAAKSQLQDSNYSNTLKPASARQYSNSYYGAASGVTGGSGGSGGGGNGTGSMPYYEKYDKYMYGPATMSPTAAAAAAFTGMPSLNTANAYAPPPPPPHYTAPDAAVDSYRKAASWHWNMDYSMGNCRSLPPPNSLPTAAILPTNAAYLPPTAAASNSHEAFLSKYDKYSGTYYQQYMTTGAGGARASWSGSHTHTLPPAMSTTERLRTQHPHTHAHSYPHAHSLVPPAYASQVATHHYQSPTTAAASLRQNCCSQPTYQQQSCYYPRTVSHHMANAYAPTANQLQQTGYHTVAGGSSTNMTTKYASNIPTDYTHKSKAMKPPPPPTQGTPTVSAPAPATAPPSANDLYVAGPYDPATHFSFNYGATSQRFPSSESMAPRNANADANPSLYYNDLNLQIPYDNYGSSLPQVPHPHQQYPPQTHHQQHHLLEASRSQQHSLSYQRQTSKTAALMDYHKAAAASGGDYYMPQQTQLQDPLHGNPSYGNYSLASNNISTNAAAAAYHNNNNDNNTNSNIDNSEKSPNNTKSLSLRDFLTTWNEDEEEFNTNNTELKFTINESQAAGTAQALVVLPSTDITHMENVTNLSSVSGTYLHEGGIHSYSHSHSQCKPMPSTAVQSAAAKVPQQLVENHLQFKGSFNTRPKIHVGITVDSTVDMEANQYINLPDIIIDIEKSNNAAAASVPETKDMSFGSFDVEKELDELQNKKINMSGANQFGITEIRQEVSKVTREDVRSTEIECEQQQAQSQNPTELVTSRQSELVKNVESTMAAVETLSKRAADVSTTLQTQPGYEPVPEQESEQVFDSPEQYLKDIDEYDTNNSNESTFEKEYESFINKIDNDITAVVEATTGTPPIKLESMASQAVQNPTTQIGSSKPMDCEEASIQLKEKVVSEELQDLTTQTNEVRKHEENCMELKESLEPLEAQDLTTETSLIKQVEHEEYETNFEVYPNTQDSQDLITQTSLLKQVQRTEKCMETKEILESQEVQDLTKQAGLLSPTVYEDNCLEMKELRNTQEPCTQTELLSNFKATKIEDMGLDQAQTHFSSLKSTQSIVSDREESTAQITEVHNTADLRNKVNQSTVMEIVQVGSQTNVLSTGSMPQNVDVEMTEVQSSLSSTDVLQNQNVDFQTDLLKENMQQNVEQNECVDLLKTNTTSTQSDTTLSIERLDCKEANFHDENDYVTHVNNFSKFHKRKRKLIEANKQCTDDVNVIRMKKSKIETHLNMKQSKNVNFPKVYTRKCRKRLLLKHNNVIQQQEQQQQSPAQQFHINSIKYAMHENKIKTRSLLSRNSWTPISMYTRIMHSLRRYRLIKRKTDTTLLLQQHLAKLRERHLPLIKRQSMKKYSDSSNSSHSQDYFNPKTLKVLSVLCINTEIFRSNILKEMEPASSGRCCAVDEQELGLKTDTYFEGLQYNVQTEQEMCKIENAARAEPELKLESGSSSVFEDRTLDTEPENMEMDEMANKAGNDATEHTILEQKNENSEIVKIFEQDYDDSTQEGYAESKKLKLQPTQLELNIIEQIVDEPVEIEGDKISDFKLHVQSASLQMPDTDTSEMTTTKIKEAGLQELEVFCEVGLTVEKTEEGAQIVELLQQEPKDWNVGNCSKKDSDVKQYDEDNDNNDSEIDKDNDDDDDNSEYNNNHNDDSEIDNSDDDVDEANNENEQTHDNKDHQDNRQCVALTKENVEKISLTAQRNSAGVGISCGDVDMQRTISHDNEKESVADAEKDSESSMVLTNSVLLPEAPDYFQATCKTRRSRLDSVSSASSSSSSSSATTSSSISRPASLAARGSSSNASSASDADSQSSSSSDESSSDSSDSSSTTTEPAELSDFNEMEELEKELTQATQDMENNVKQLTKTTTTTVATTNTITTTATTATTTATATTTTDTNAKKTETNFDNETAVIIATTTTTTNANNKNNHKSTNVNSAQKITNLKNDIVDLQRILVTSDSEESCTHTIEVENNEANISDSTVSVELVTTVDSAACLAATKEIHDDAASADELCGTLSGREVCDKFDESGGNSGVVGGGGGGGGGSDNSLDIPDSSHKNEQLKQMTTEIAISDNVNSAVTVESAEIELTATQHDVLKSAGNSEIFGGNVENNFNIPKLSDLCEIALSTCIYQSNVLTTNNNINTTKTTTNTNTTTTTTATTIKSDIVLATTEIASNSVLETSTEEGRELSVEEALAEMYRQVGVLSDAEEFEMDDKSAQAQDVFLINLEEILDSDSDVYVLQCDMNENILGVVAHTDDANVTDVVNVNEVDGVVDVVDVVSAERAVQQSTMQLVEILNANEMNNTTQENLTIISTTDPYIQTMTDERSNISLPTTTDLEIDDIEFMQQFDMPITIHHEEIVPENYTKFAKEKFLKYLHEKYVQKNISKYYHANNIVKKYKRRLLKRV